MVAINSYGRPILAVACLTLIISAGCQQALAHLDAPADGNNPSDVRSAIPEEATVDQLYAYTEDSLKEAVESASLLSSHGRTASFRVARFQEHVEQGVAAAEKLLTHPQSTGEHQEFARQAKMLLLSHGARQVEGRFREPLRTFVSELQHQGDDRLSAIGEAVLVELTMKAPEASEEAVMAALEDYGQRYPHCGAGLALFQQYGAQLEKQEMSEQAIVCYRTAVALYGNLPDATAVRSRLVALENLAAAKASRSQATQARQRAIREQLGDEHGYFVIYAKEIKPPSNQMFQLHAFQYEVLHGATAAVSFISGLRSNWQWELVERFPDTPDGFAQAQELAKQLTKKRAFIKY